VRTFKVAPGRIIRYLGLLAIGDVSTSLSCLVWWLSWGAWGRSGRYLTPVFSSQLEFYSAAHWPGEEGRWQTPGTWISRLGGVPRSTNLPRDTCFGGGFSSSSKDLAHSPKSIVQQPPNFGFQGQSLLVALSHASSSFVSINGTTWCPRASAFYSTARVVLAGTVDSRPRVSSLKDSSPPLYIR